MRFHGDLIYSTDAGQPGIIINVKTGTMRGVLNDIPATTALADRPIVGDLSRRPITDRLANHAVSAGPPRVTLNVRVARATLATLYLPPQQNEVTYVSESN